VKRLLRPLVSFSSLVSTSLGSTVVTDVTGFGYDINGIPLSSPPTHGQAVYDESGTLTGTWTVTTGNTFTADQDQNNRNETSSISYNGLAKINNTNGADRHSASFASFDAADDSSDFIVIESEVLAMSVSWDFRDMRWQRRDMTNTSQTYDVTWTITSFDNLNADLGSQTGAESITSLGVGTDFGYTGYTDANPSGGSNQIVTASFTGDVPTSLLEYNGSASGQLTGKYDGSNFVLTLRASQERDTNATTWNESMNGDGDLRIGENPRAQLRAYIDADYNYTLTYTTYTFVEVPEQGTVVLSLMGTLYLLRRRNCAS